MIKLIIFPDPLDSNCELIIDNGVKLTGKPDTHVSGRPGQSFDIPGGTPSSIGCSLTITHDKYVSLFQRSILRVEDIAYLMADDFRLVLEKVCPENPVPPNPNPATEPFDIIKEVYATGDYNLETKEGCGQFTEACCKQLHERHSSGWGYVRKFPPQNMYNGHGVDVVQLKVPVKGTAADIYDIIISSESPDAEPAFNSKGPAIQDLWYYPADGQDKINFLKDVE